MRLDACGCLRPQTASSTSSQSVGGFSGVSSGGWHRAAQRARPGSAFSSLPSMSVASGRTCNSADVARLMQRKHQLQSQMQRIEQQLYVCDGRPQTAASIPASDATGSVRPRHTAAMMPTATARGQRAHGAYVVEASHAAPSAQVAASRAPALPPALEPGRYAFWSRALRSGSRHAPTLASSERLGREGIGLSVTARRCP